MDDGDTATPGKCEAINESNASRCRKDAVGPFAGKGYCTTHLKRLRQQQQHAQRTLELPLAHGRSEQCISGGRPWIAAVFEDDFIAELSLYQVSVVVDGDMQRRPTGTWPPRPGHPLPWLWGPSKATAERIAARFNEERGYGTNDVRRILRTCAPKGNPAALIAPTRGDLQCVDSSAEFISFHGNNNQFYWSNLTYKRFTGLAGVGSAPAWGASIHPEDIPIAYEAWAQVLRSNEPYVLDVRLLHRESMQYGWYRVTSRPIFLPESTTFLFRSIVASPLHVDAVVYRAATIDAFHFRSDKRQQQLRDIVHNRIHRHAQQQHLLQQRQTVAFVPHQEKRPHYGYQLALVTTPKTGYTRVGDLPYLPTPNYYPPIFLGPDYDAAQEVADKFNACRDIDREMALNILHHSKCLAL